MSNLITASLRRRWTKLIVCLLLSSLLVAPASLAQQPQEPYLVKDINQQSVGGGSFVGPLTAVGDRLFFYGDDAWHGREVWASDGTTDGTRLVADIGAGYDWPSFEYLTAVRGMLYFSAWSDGYGRELWVSDGTTAGTRLVADIWPGDGSSYASAFTPVGDTLFFRADDGVHGSELWALPLPPLAARMYLPLIRR